MPLDDCTGYVKIKLNSVTRVQMPGIEAANERGPPVKLYGLKTCDTCRKALKELETAEFHDLRADGLPKDVARAAHARFGSDLVNRRSTTWRQLSEADRSRDALALLADHPTLMKRPLIDDDGTLYLGWGKDTRAALLG